MQCIFCKTILLTVSITQFGSFKIIIVYGSKNFILMKIIQLENKGVNDLVLKLKVGH